MKTVSAGIIIRGHKIFICQRPEGKPQAGFWEFPGGKQEPGESVEDCLRRELKEELNINVEVRNFIMESIYNYDTGSIRLVAYLVSVPGNEEIRSNIHCQTKWISPSEVDNYNFAPADLPIAAALKQRLENFAA